MNKKKIINDPVYGFITIYNDLLYDVIEHPYFQRLRRIKQMGLADFVYPGALHTRFHHALGAMHLMGITLDNLRSKGAEISDKEYEASLLAILLHDIGHGPFSHSLEFNLIPGISHEQLSLLIIEDLNRQMQGALDTCIEIFSARYPRKFFNQLVSSQLDIDRLDYLNRDSFFTGVSEGTVAADRIIKMLDIVDDEIVVEEKGIYSIENFLNARRLMYWQVYLHKTSISAETLLILMVRRARLLAKRSELHEPEALVYFLKHDDFTPGQLLERFVELDDYDLWTAIKAWKKHKDPILQRQAQMFLNREFLKVNLSSQKAIFKENKEKKQAVARDLNIPIKVLNYFFAEGSISNAAYIAGGETINIKTKKGQLLDVAKASDLPNIKAMSKIVKKYYTCWPRALSLQVLRNR